MQEAIQASKLALQYIERERNDVAFDSIYSRLVNDCEDLTNSPCLPRQRRPPHRLGTGETAHTFNSPEPFFHQQYFEVFDIVCSEFKHRFQQERGMPAAAALEKALLDAMTTAA